MFLYLEEDQFFVHLFLGCFRFLESASFSIQEAA